MNKNLLLYTILIFIYILFQLCNPNKVEKFNNNIIDIPFIREINLNKSPKTISKRDIIPYSNKNEIKTLSIDNEYTAAYDLVGTSTELRDIEVNNNTNQLYDNIKNSNLSNILLSKYDENSEFIEGSLERDYDFSVENVNYLATDSDTKTTNSISDSLKNENIKKIYSLPIIYSSKDRKIIADSINNDKYNSFFDYEKKTPIIQSSSGIKTSRNSDSKMNKSIEDNNIQEDDGISNIESKNVGSVGTISKDLKNSKSDKTSSLTSVNSIYNVSNSSNTNKKNQSYKSQYDINDLNNIDTTNNSSETNETNETNEKSYININLLEDNKKIIDNVGVIIENIVDIINDIYIFIKNSILNFYKLLFNDKINDVISNNLNDNKNNDDNESNNDSINDGLFKHIEDLFESIYIFFKDIFIKIINSFENFSDNVYNFFIKNY